MKSALAARQHPLQNAVAADEMVIEPGRDMQADQHQHQVASEHIVHVAGPALARCPRANQFRKFDSEDCDRHAAP